MEISDFSMLPQVRNAKDDALLPCQSRERPFDLLCFNLAAEEALGTILGPAPIDDNPDFEALQIFLAKPRQAVRFTETPSADFLRSWVRLGLTLPEIWPQNIILPGDRRVASIQPWARTPDAVQFAREWGAKKPFKTTALRLFSKVESAKILNSYLKSHPDSILSPVTTAGIPCSTRTEILEVLRSLRDQGYAYGLMKPNFGFGGRRQRKIETWKPLSQGVERAIERLLERDSVIVEPFFERIWDLSLSMITRRGQPKAVKLLRLLSDLSGAYAGHSTCLPTPPSDEIGASLERHIRQAVSAVATHLATYDYEGPASIDMFCHRNPILPSESHLRPIVEINPRFTMAHVARKLFRFIRQGSTGTFLFVGRKDCASVGSDGFSGLLAKLQAQLPEHITMHQNRPRISRGVFACTDPERARSCLALLLVDDHPRDPGEWVKTLGLMDRWTETWRRLPQPSPSVDWPLHPKTA